MLRPRGARFLTNVSVSNTQFLNNVFKGAYFEKLSGAWFSDVTVTGNGTRPPTSAGFDLNLKYGDYSNIRFTDATFTNDGSGAASGIGLAIKGRNDAPSYNTNPASLTGVTLTDVSISGSPTDLAIGNNVTGVTFSGVSLGGTGLGLAYYVTTADTLNLADAAFDGALATYIINSSANPVDAAGASFGGVNGATATLPQLFAVEDTIVDAIDVSGFGLVRLKAGDVYVTPTSFFAPTTTAPSIRAA